ncbi:hypothetical protein [Cellulomonas sp. PhB143]|uniref:hypothetical protein n=1 Tax=Cellulomonas sp. PhB143 TaxID=2485186 RepID=UPI000F479F75|nr:hypothetical protein [Cellulomonas sp. PhB143]ROS73604.1 hypothetical protein EDF32_2457 [Cellulomonas sp. PhB143]
MDTTTIKVRTSTRDRLRKYAESQSVTFDGAVDRLLAEHAEREFWAAMGTVTPAEYEAAMREDGTWPGDDDSSVEEAMIRAEEARG